MAVRSPLYWTGDGFRPMNSTQVGTISDRAIYLYAQNPAVTLTRVASNGNLSEMIDTRFQAGDMYSRVDRFGTAAETPDISLVTETWDNISQNNASGTSYPTDTNNIAFPVYLDTDGNIVSMTQQDFIDTFISPAIVNMTKNSSSNSSKGGTYEIHSNLEFNPLPAEIPAHLEPVSSFPVFTNTIADITKYTAAGIPETKDQPKDVELYYLYKYIGASSAPAMLERPLYLTSATNPQLREFSDNQIDQLLTPAIRHESLQSGNKITYAISTSSTATNRRGTMIDTRLTGSSASGKEERFAGIDAYFTQEFPNGIEAVQTTYYLTVERT